MFKRCTTFLEIGMNTRADGHGKAAVTLGASHVWI
jgi:hypothetical protein